VCFPLSGGKADLTDLSVSGCKAEEAGAFVGHGRGIQFRQRPESSMSSETALSFLAEDHAIGQRLGGRIGAEPGLHGCPGCLSTFPPDSPGRHLD